MQLRSTSFRWRQRHVDHKQAAEGLRKSQQASEMSEGAQTLVARAGGLGLGLELGRQGWVRARLRGVLPGTLLLSPNCGEKVGLSHMCWLKKGKAKQG